MAASQFFTYNGNMWNLNNIVGVSKKDDGSFVVLTTTGGEFDISREEGQALLRFIGA